MRKNKEEGRAQMTQDLTVLMVRTLYILSERGDVGIQHGEVVWTNFHCKQIPLAAVWGADWTRHTRGDRETS